MISAGLALGSTLNAVCQEEDRKPILSEPAVAEVLWEFPGEIRSPAVSIEGSELLVCLRPPGNAGAKPSVLKIGDRELEAKVLLEDPKSGLLLLEPLPAPGDSSSAETTGSGMRNNAAIDEKPAWPRPGTEIVARAAGASPELKGRIAGRDLIFQGRETPVTYLRVHLPPKADVSGGRLIFDARKNRLLGFLIPAPIGNPGAFHAVPAVFAAKLVRNHEARQGTASARLGASFDVGSTTPQIVSIRSGSPADQAGLVKNDVLLRVGSWRVHRLSDVIEALRTLTPEIPAEIEVLRGLESKTLTIVPEASGSK